VQIIQKLLDVLLLVPSVFKLARDTFLQVAYAISISEIKEEIYVLVRGLLLSSANVRNAVLQALDSFDLEETENPEILFMAIQDTDDRNSELAIALYESNSVSLDSRGLSRLFSFLGISNASLF
jgi:hypothetical protein